MLKAHIMEMYKGCKYEILCILDLGGHCHALTALALKKLPDTHYLGGWMGPEIRLDFMARRRVPSTRNRVWFAQPVADYFTDSSLLSYLMVCFLN
jgi:hypothetical protein